MNPDRTFTDAEAFRAMFVFLEEYYLRTKSNDVGALLGSMSILPNGKPLDAAMWTEWLTCLEWSKLGNVDDQFRIEPRTK